MGWASGVFTLNERPALWSATCYSLRAPDTEGLSGPVLFDNLCFCHLGNYIFSGGGQGSPAGEARGHYHLGSWALSGAHQGRTGEKESAPSHLHTLDMLCPVGRLGTYTPGGHTQCSHPHPIFVSSAPGPHRAQQSRWSNIFVG